MLATLSGTAVPTSPVAEAPATTVDVRDDAEAVAEPQAGQDDELDDEQGDELDAELEDDAADGELDESELEDDEELADQAAAPRR
jgi:hypothetical protein